jgi:hypothetical protein
VSPVKYELCFYIPEDEILHRRYPENLKSYKTSTGLAPITKLKFDLQQLQIEFEAVRSCRVNFTENSLPTPLCVINHERDNTCLSQSP